MSFRASGHLTEARSKAAIPPSFYHEGLWCNDSPLKKGNRRPSLHQVRMLADSSRQYSRRLFVLIPHRRCSRQDHGNRKGWSRHTATQRLFEIRNLCLDVQHADFASGHSEASLIAPCVPQNGLDLVVNLLIMVIVDTYHERTTSRRSEYMPSS